MNYMLIDIKDADDVKEMVELTIKNAKSDPELAHSNEDSLYWSVLDAVANGNPNAVEMAKEALKTKTVDFPRWCA